VTGAGCAPAWAGLDVFDSSGEAIPVVWKDFGIRLYQAAEVAYDGPPGPGQSVGATATGRGRFTRNRATAVTQQWSDFVAECGGTAIVSLAVCLGIPGQLVFVHW
jgi:hypothetical protein